jgi:hypothetical protein
MSWVRGEDYNKDLVVVAVIEKFFSKMAAVAVKDKKAVTWPRFLLCKLIKHLFIPRQPKVIVCPPRLRIAKKYLVFSWHNVVYPRTAKSCLSLKDYS